MVLNLPDPTLADEVVLLRQWSFDDLECVREAGTDPAIPLLTTVPSSWSVEAGRAFVTRQGQRRVAGEGLSLAIHSRERGVAVGLVSLMLRPQPGVVGFGYWIVPSARQHGFARRAAVLASDWAVGVGGFARIEAWVAPTNQPSVAVLCAAGFELEGRLRSFLSIGGSRSDALVYSRIPTPG